MPIAVCPECEEDVYVGGDFEQGSIIPCDECGVDLEIVGMDPIELDPFMDKDDDDEFSIYDDE